MTLGICYQSEMRYSEAEAQYKRALAIREKALGPNDPKLLPILKNYADVLLAQQRPMEAVDLIKRMHDIEANGGRA